MERAKLTVIDTSQDAMPAPRQVAQAAAPDAARSMTLFVMVVATLYFGKEVLVPVTLALLLAFVLAPLVDLLRRARLGRIPSVLLGVFLALGVILAVGGVIGTQIAELTNDIPRYVTTVETKVSAVRAYTLGRLFSLTEKIGPHQAGKVGNRAGVQSTPPPSREAQVSASPVTPASGSSSLELANRYLSPVLSPLATFGIVFVVAVFALLQKEDLRNRLIRLVGSDDLHRTTLAIDDGTRRLSTYFLTQLSVNTIFGIVVCVGLLVIGIPDAVLSGILSALLRFVPYVGLPISALLPMALAAAVQPGWSMVLWTAVLYIVVEGVTGQVVEPMIYVHSTGMSPFSVVVAAIFWSWLWGPIGLILSTPLTLCLVVIGRHVKRLEFLDIMLGDRPALSPVESFYQCILTGDADEAQAHAELLLNERALSTYYDEVALKGLQMAANDVQRGVLDRDKLDRIKSTIKSLIAGLEDHDDRQPPAARSDDGVVMPPDDERELPRNGEQQIISTAGTDLHDAWKGAAAILCIAGRGPLDEAAAAMLVQLLGKHGMGGHLVGYQDVSREKITTLDVTDAAMVCISYLDISGNPAHLRYLMQRLRQRLPQGIPILVGLWPAEDPTLKDEKTEAAVGADYFASSLEQAVNTCSRVALKAGSLTPSHT